MGWFSRIVDQVIDPVLPETVKRGVDNMLPEVVKKNQTARTAVALLGGIGGFGGVAGLGGFSTMLDLATVAGYTKTAGSDGTDQSIDIGNLSVDEIANLSSSRWGRLGKYFTSPLGVLSGASTGSGKVFS